MWPATVPQQSLQTRTQSIARVLNHSILIPHLPETSAADQTQSRTIMCQHHIMLYRKCDHTFHATAPCLHVLNHKACRDRPEDKFPTFSWSSHDIDLQVDWCASCTPLAQEALVCFADRGLNSEILDKLVTAWVRGRMSGLASGPWFAGPGPEYQTCPCCSEMPGFGGV